MRRFTLSVLAGSLLLTGCALGGVWPGRTALETREVQTRTYATRDTRMLMKALINVLQDDGFMVESASLDLGLVTATKEVDLENRGMVLFGGILNGARGAKGDDATWSKLVIIEATANVSEYGEASRVRVTFREKVIDNRGLPVSVRPIEDARDYQDFFARVDKGVFIEEQKL